MSLHHPIKKLPITVLIGVKNEAQIIARCLAALPWVDEIIVVDSHSTDATVEIATSYGAQVIQFDFNGYWPKKIGWAIANLSFKHKWIFMLDADEVLPNCIYDELAAITQQAQPTHLGYWINRRFFFIGKWLEHAYYPNWVLRLFYHPFGQFQQMTSAEQTTGDREALEPFIVQGSCGYLKTCIDHYAFPTIESFVDRHNRYSNWEAHVQVENQAIQAACKAQGQMKWKWWLKAIFLHLPFRPTLRFLYVYIFQLGFLDGREGYYFAKLHGFYEFLNVAKTYELKKKAKTGL